MCYLFKLTLLVLFCKKDFKKLNINFKINFQKQFKIKILVQLQTNFIYYLKSLKNLKKEESKAYKINCQSAF